MTNNTIRSLIEESIKTSMKKGEREQTTTLRMAISELQNEEIDKKSVLKESETIMILQKMIKQRKDSQEQFQSAGREELALKEGREIEILNQFLPKQLSEEEIRKTISKAIESLKAETPQDIGKVMGSLKSSLLGKADMSLVSKIVKESLSN